MKIDDTTMLCILHSLVGNHKTRTKDGSTLLHVVCKCTTSCDKKTLVEYLLTECQCDPNCLDSKGQSPLQLTSDSEVMKVLIEHGAKMTTDFVFKVISSAQLIESGAELFALSSMKGTMLWHPTDLNSDGYNALHLACKADNFNIVNFLLSVAHCDPNIKSNNEEEDSKGQSPLQLTSDSEVMKILIEYGAKMTTDVVFKVLLSEHNIITESEAVELFSLSSRKGTMLWQPTDLNRNGETVFVLSTRQLL